MGKIHDEQNIKILPKHRISATRNHIGVWGDEKWCVPICVRLCIYFNGSFFFSELHFENIIEDFASIKARRAKLPSILFGVKNKILSHKIMLHFDTTVVNFSVFFSTSLMFSERYSLKITSKHTCGEAHGPSCLGFQYSLTRHCF